MRFLFKLLFDDLPYGLLKLFSRYIPKAKARWLACYYPDSRLRKLFFQLTNVEIGENTFISANVVVLDEYQTNKNLLKIGNRAGIAPGVIFIASSSPVSSSLPNSSNLKYHPYVKNKLICSKRIIVKDDAWIGAGAIIFPGVTIGEGAVVGAGAVVLEDVAPYTIVVGNPAKKVRKLNERFIQPLGT